ncbi:MAG: transcription antitermination factor NusB [Myxococcota bacterium]
MSSASPKSGRSEDTDPRDPRSQGRELALLALCHLESYPPEEYEEALALLWRSAPRGDDPRGRAFSKMVANDEVRRRADGLALGLIAKWTEVDGTISETSRRWRLERMAQVDRNVLRLAAYELGHRPNTPRPVVLAEAVRLARRYGSERSPTFVNGVAEALARRLRGGGASKPAKAGADG